MNNILKQSSNPCYKTLEEALPQYYSILEFCREYESPIFDQEEEDLFNLIHKMGFQAFQVINKSYNHASSEPRKTIRDMDIERLFIVQIVAITEHVLEIAKEYNGTFNNQELNHSRMEYLYSTISEGNRLAGALENVLSKYD